MAAIIRDITIEQGGVLDETFILKSNGVVVDLTGYSSIMIIKDNAGATVFTASTVLGSIIINGPAGSVRRKISAEVTKTIPVKSVSYDWELTPPSGVDDTWKLYRGKCHVILEGSSGR